jgi:hypothetical protein
MPVIESELATNSVYMLLEYPLTEVLNTSNPAKNRYWFDEIAAISVPFGGFCRGNDAGVGLVWFEVSKVCDENAEIIEARLYPS